MKLVVINKDNLSNIPPLISVINILADLGHDVRVITGGVPDSIVDVFKAKGIKWDEIKFDKSDSRIVKVYQYVMFRKRVMGLLNKLEFEYLWIEGGNTIRSLGTSIMQYKYILQISEMYEFNKAILASIRKVIGKAEAVVIPEYCRSVIYKVWFGLERYPYVLLNKPDIFPSEADCTDTLLSCKELINKIQNKKIILYQGGISRTRMLDRIAEAMKQINSNYHLLLVGTEQEAGLIESLKSITPEVSHIPFIPAPNYLAFCNIAHIGYVFYAPTSLNNIFCAPNKICEYSAYGLPMLGNDIPGLKYTIGVAGAGVMVDPSRTDNIITALNYIESNYKSISDNSRIFNKSVDNRRVIEQCLQDIQNR